MTTVLFRRIEPAKKFRITKRQIAKFLGIAESLIAEVERWPYVLYIHRRDRGGQFISYRQLEHWKNAIASHIQQCFTLQQLQHLWSVISRDSRKHSKQYDDSIVSFLQKIWAQCRENLAEDSAAILCG